MPRSERETLRTSAYAAPDKLRARQRLWSYADQGQWSSGRVNWAYPLRGDETVVDVGCGNGRDLLGARGDGHHGALIGVDFSLGMLASVPRDVAYRVVGDAERIPLRSGCADVVLMMHMLYHVADLLAALREGRRLLRPDGIFLASTNSETSLQGLRAAWSEAMVAAGGPPLERVSEQVFSLENGGAQLASVFSSVDLKPTETTVSIPEARVVRDYVASTDDLYRPRLPSDEAWQSVLDAVERHAQAEIDADGAFTVTQRAGVFVCRP